ncbi:lamin tail domain-containing protein [Streptomyces sp. NBC_00233]|uniref:lamin tail domain-containing protein n=1 Tax=Streptomyces sp. NBC_00233 TaxID=2975686 RepID=UPI00224F27D3|nr:lamin tail domain-containing protein [Streptomyces sp. NBC_00233]MCX5233561.1 lamin tail domain-containing protein [Streptomyces sp. NBC_00233]
MFRRNKIPVAAVLTGLAAGLVTLNPEPAGAVSTSVVISEIYGGGGNNGAIYNVDFIELYNRGTTTVSLDGWTVQYASATGSSWQTTALSGSLKPGRHYLVKQAGNGVGTPLPAPDATGTISLSATAGKVALSDKSRALTCSSSCTTVPGVRDFVGYGSTASSFEGSPAPAPSVAASIGRVNGVDTDTNGRDFVKAAPTPYNSSVGTPESGEACSREVISGPAGLTAKTLEAGDPSGRYQAGRAVDSADVEHLVLWTDGVAEDLGVPALGANSFPSDVNGHGEIVGNVFMDGNWRGWRRRGGQFTPVTLPASALTADAVAINGNGEMAGTSFRAAYAQDGRATVWSTDNSARELTRPAGFNDARALDIDDDGTVIGTVSLLDYDTATTLDQRAVAWFPDGTWRFLNGIRPTDQTEAKAIRNGRVVGTTASGGILAWNAVSGDVTQLSPEGRPVEVNSTGSVTTTNLELILPSGVRRPLPIFDPVHGGASRVLTDANIVYGKASYYDEDLQATVAPLLRWNCGS